MKRLRFARRERRPNGHARRSPALNATAPPVDHSQVGRQELVESVRSVDPLLSTVEVRAEVERLLDVHEQLGPIAPLLREPDVTEVLANGPGPLWVERAGHLQRTSRSIDGYELDLLIERILTPLGLRVDRSAPIVDARLSDGSRVNVVVPPLAIDGPALSIRRFVTATLGPERFGPPAMVAVLKRLVEAKASMLVTGPTGSGKTTLINTLCGLVDPDERVVSIEDTAELQLPLANLVRLEARPANSEGVGAVGLGDLVRTALRMRPDRLVVGEVRGPEAFDLLLALSSGHRGCLASCHGGGPEAVLRRLETLATMAGSGLEPAGVRALIHDGLDAVITVGRADNGEREVLSIVELDDGARRSLWSADGQSVASIVAADRLRAC